MDILTGEMRNDNHCRQYSLLILTSFIDHIIMEKGGVKGWKDIIFISTFCAYCFIRVHENLVQHPGNNVPIVTINHLRF